MRELNKELLEVNIDKIANFDLLENNVFGSSYIVRQNGEKILEKFYGYTGTEGSEIVNPDTVFRLASMTKPITAVAVLLLIDRGLLSLFDTVKKYYHQFENIHVVSKHGVDSGITKTDVTIMHLLTHTSGFGSIKPVNMSVEDRETIDNSINYFARAGLDFEPFTKQAYSGCAAFDVLAGIVEKVTDCDYEEFLIREIFSPCNMTDTFFTPNENQLKRIINMHNKSDGKNCISPTVENCIFEGYPYRHKLGGAGLASTISDYSNFAEMLLNKGKTNCSQIISEETFNLMPVAYVPYEIMPQNERWGLGVRVITDDSYRRLPVGTFGWSGAYGTHFWVDPENKITAVFMKNSRFDGGAGNQSACRFEEAVHNSLTE